MPRMSVRAILIVIIGMSFAYACATTPIQEIEAPKWVIKGSGAFNSKDSRVFHGVGSSFGIKNPSLLRTTAENRARNEIAKIFKVYVSSFMKGYMASTLNVNTGDSSEEQHIEQAVKTITSETLKGAEIIDYWQNPKTEEFFALARLDMAAFEKIINNTDKLGLDKKRIIKHNAKLLHEELIKEADRTLENN